MDLTSRAHVSARGERGRESCERRNSEEKAYSKNAPMVLRPTGLGERWQPAGHVSQHGEDWARSQEKIQTEILLGF
jgi:hypothetical protein